MTDIGLVKVQQAKENGEWDRLSSEFEKNLIHPEFEKALKKNKKARENFKNFAPSYQKMAIWWISSAKRPETQQRRIKETIELAEANKKFGMK